LICFNNDVIFDFIVFYVDPASGLPYAINLCLFVVIFHYTYREVNTFWSRGLAQASLFNFMHLQRGAANLLHLATVQHSFSLVSWKS